MSDFDLWDGDDDSDSLEPSGQIDDFLGIDSAYLRDIMEQYGIVDFQDFVVDLSAVERPEDIRGVRFATLGEAVSFLFEIGVLGFSEIVTIDDVYAVVIGDSPSAS